MLPNKFFLLAAMALTFQVRAQLFYLPDQTVPVIENGTQLSLPWAGGLNAPQFNTIDLNGDGQMDLVIFDRIADKLLTFLNQNKSYLYAPEYEALFPADITHWLLLRDINCDGKKDIFTHDPFGMKAFINVTSPGGKLTWRVFNPGFPILTFGFGHAINLQMNSSDIPAIDDLDGDGDLDILDARFSGVGSVEYHRNMSVENTGACDSMQFVRYSLTWGNFEECNCGKYLFGIDSTCLKYGRVDHAAGKALLSIDFNNDNIRDLLFTEENCNNLYLMANTGTKDTAAVHSAVVFPPGNPIDLQIFPAPYYEDVDFDNLPDLVVASNVSARSAFSNNFRQNVLLFKNTGTLQFPSFTFIRNDFLQGQMIDVGDNAVPAFFDEDGDGDLDLFVGNYSGVSLPASLFFFRNDGTPGNPSFELVTSDYAGLSALNLFNLKPQFADLNADQKTDLVVSGTDLTTAVTSFYFIANRSKSKLDITGQPLVNTQLPMSQSENVLAVDVDQDGLTDALVGKGTGSVEYWINNGPAGSVNFALQDNAYLGFGVSTGRQSIAMTVADLDADGKTDLLWGDQNGSLAFIRNFRSSAATEPEHVLYFNHLIDSAKSPQLGGRVWPAAVNLYNANRPALVTGNVLGGLHILKNDASQELPTDPVISIFPNPVQRGQDLEIISDRDIMVAFVSVLGQKFSDEFQVNAHQPGMLSTQGLSAGLYVARISVRGKIYARKVMVR